jgi:hypothetical protein
LNGGAYAAPLHDGTLLGQPVLPPVLVGRVLLIPFVARAVVTILMAVMVAAVAVEDEAVAWPTAAPIPKVVKIEATTAITP